MPAEVGGTDCLSENEIEGLVFGRLTGKAKERCISHLLWCSECQQRVEEETEFARATRGAAAALEEEDRAQARQRWKGHRLRGALNRIVRFDWSSRTIALAAGACLVVAIAVVLPLRRDSRAEAEIVLHSERGNPTPASADASSGTAPRFRIDVEDVGAYPSYGVTLTDARGSVLASVGE